MANLRSAVSSWTSVHCGMGLFAPAHGLRKAIVSRAPGPPREEGCCRRSGAA